MAALIWTAASVALLLLAVYFLFCAHLVNRFLRRRPYDPDRFVRGLKGTAMEPYGEIILREREWFAKQDREDVFIESYDHLSLHGQYLTQKDARGTMLLVHGFQSSGEGDFSCILKEYYSMGFNLLVIDQRASLQSQGDYLTMGVRERWDVRSWCIWLLQRMGERHRVVLDGISMGGATVLMAAGLDLPPNVVGVIADCPFTSPRDIFEHVMRTSIKLPTWLLWGADLCCRLMAGFSIDGARTGQRRHLSGRKRQRHLRRASPLPGNGGQQRQGAVYLPVAQPVGAECALSFRDRGRAALCGADLGRLLRRSGQSKAGRRRLLGCLCPGDRRRGTDLLEKAAESIKNDPFGKMPNGFSFCPRKTWRRRRDGLFPYKLKKGTVDRVFHKPHHTVIPSM